MTGRALTRALGLLLLTALAGCGQKGPLYLPDEARGIVTRPAPSPAPADGSQTSNTPGTADTPPAPANPAPEVTPPETDKDKKEQGAQPPR